MRIFTKPGETGAPTARVEQYETAFGVGRLVTADELPLLVELPGAAGTSPLPPSASRSDWASLLEHYFGGAAVRFPLDLDAYAARAGLTPFERDVYAALAEVPYGTVLSYRELAAAAGRPNAYRAAGSVMARNRLPIILPCHRVVRNDGRLGRYGEDPAWKARLLALEGVRVKEGRLA